MKARLHKFFSNPYVLISIVYLLAHFFLLILSGCWWDDWTFSTHNIEYIHQVASQSGRPEWNILVPFCWSLPNNGRILIFFLFYGVSLFVYQLLKGSGLFDDKESLIITLLFTIIPVNDARLLISNFVYSVGLFFFYLSFMFFVYWNRMEESRRKNICRVLLLICFYLGFLLNSVLAFYYIVIAYLFVLDIRKNDEKNIIRKIFISIKNVLFHYPDFFILPFVYYAVNKLFFPTYGDNFGGYNQVTISSLIRCIIFVPLSALNCLYRVLISWLEPLGEWWILALFSLFALLLFFFLYRKKTTEKEYKKNELLWFALFGVFALLLSLLPYVVVRGRLIEMTGIQGRDAMLTPLGLGIIVFVLISLISEKYRRYVLILIISLGIIRFDLLYLEWQKDYYYQLSMENLLADKFVKENDTFFLADLNESELGGQRYYGLNTNGYNVFGDQSRLFMPKVYDIYILDSDESIRATIEKLNYSTMMKDYKPEDNNLDGVLIYSCNLSTAETIRLKLLEMSGDDDFLHDIQKNGEMVIVPVEDDFTILLRKEMEKGNISNDEDLLMLLFTYLGEENHAN